MKGLKYFYVLVFAFFFLNVISQPAYVCTGTSTDPEFVGKNIEILVDESGKMNFDEVRNSTGFKKSEEDVPNLGFISGHVWLRFQVQNNSKDHFLVFELQAPLIDEVEFFSQTDSLSFTSQLTGQIIAFSKRKYDHPVYLFDLHTKPGQTRSYYLRIRSSDQIELPMRVNTRVNIFTPVTNKNFMFGIYCGMMIIMILYNLFVYFSVKDKSYLVYVVYILAILFTQTTFQGYTFKYVWPEFPKFETMSIHLMSIFVGFASVQFLRVFLQTKLYVPKFDQIFKIAYVFYALATVLVLMGYLQLTWVLILCIVSPLSMFMLFVGIRVTALGYKPAKFFTLAWSVFLVGVFIYAMKDFGILPHNGFTVYTMPIGSAIETVLLSIALADRINILKKEKAESDAKAMQVLKDNERMITEQNMQLELKVRERTAELEASNKSLKEAEASLISAEKMASLGQLTAGISHEINNPINFVVANVKPLKRDVEEVLLLLSKYTEIKDGETFNAKQKELKDLAKKLDVDYLTEEINQLLKGIDEGANRTSEIVKGLKTFARSDESDIKKINIHEGIDATLSLLNNFITHEKIEVVKKYGDLPLIDAYPGKLNQVFMNLLNNAMQAISAKTDLDSPRIITIETEAFDKEVTIKIKDTGTGMPESILSKIFEPFFTTKDVGSGTGLGLSIVYGIIKNHAGHIKVESREHHGSTFIITLPITLANNKEV